MDGSLYTGITTNPERRIAEHNAGPRGAAYTRGRRPVQLVYQVNAENRAEASRIEVRIKRLTRAQKEALVRSADAPDCLAFGVG